MKANKKNLTPSAKARREKLLRRLKFYSTAAGLGAFACASGAQGQIVHYDIPDISITNSGAQASSLFIDIHADGPGNPDASAPEWQIAAPKASNQIRIDKEFTIPPSATLDDPFADHTDLGTLDEGNQVLSPTAGGYYTGSVPAGFLISRGTLDPTFYAGLAARSTNPVGYNFVGVGGHVGLEWDFDGTDDVRYGWAQIDLTPVNGDPEGFFTATLTAYAIQMTPNTPIEAGATGIPEPGSLALLAAGCGGLGLARRRRSK